MKAILCCTFLLIASLSFAQNPNDPDGLQKLLADGEIEIDNFQTKVYSNGVRLDSIEAAYATFTWYGSMFHFDYGQNLRKVRQTVLTDKAGKKILYKYGTLAGALNLLHYNGWEVVEHYKSGEDLSPSFLMKKKQLNAAQ